MTKELSIYGRPAASVFDLLGRGETDLTAALGWTLTRSPRLVGAIWERLGMPGTAGDAEVSLEDVDQEGRTDLTIMGAEGQVIVEAKKGWLLPGALQLSKYTSRFNRAKVSLLVTLSDSSLEYSALHLPKEVNGIPVRHLPWDEIRADLRTATNGTRGTERVWLEELATYLAGATAVRDPAEQWVYVVSIGAGKPIEGGERSFRDFVEVENRYFHPFGKNWPRRPPVLMGFRWGGKLQRVSRVIDSKVAGSLSEEWPDIPGLAPDGIQRPVAIYKLGPPIPIPEIRTTGVVMSRRLWALLDQILTHPLLLDAEKASKAITKPGD